MLARVDLRGYPGGPTPAQLRASLPRAASDINDALADVREICDDVAARGLVAVQAHSKRLDGVVPDSIKVSAEALDLALAELDPPLRAALEEAVARAWRVHAAALPEPAGVQVVPGGEVRRRFLPVQRVGLYVPGGLVAYPSSVVMNVVPAQVAGVGSLVVASPPQAGYGGLPHPAILAACALLGVREVYAMGGAQAVAALAFGLPEVGLEPVDMITGPGNRYVAAAKRLLRGTIGIDAEAGPTEIAIIADATAAANVVAADLVAQAEHDALAACLLVTPEVALADAVDAELEVAVAGTRYRDRVRAALTGASATVLVDDLDAALAVTDSWAPEHLEIITADARELASRVRAAGAVFVGGFTPVSLGDYLAGSNHVLPTGGTARHAAGLSAWSFLRLVNVVEYDRAALADSLAHVRALGAAEALPAHVHAVEVRL
ncbi:MAG: histidinol dehydrogenase [Mycobacteriales bacterium]